MDRQGIQPVERQQPFRRPPLSKENERRCFDIISTGDIEAILEAVGEQSFTMSDALIRAARIHDDPELISTLLDEVKQSPDRLPFFGHHGIENRVFFIVICNGHYRVANLLKERGADLTYTLLRMVVTIQHRVSMDGVRYLIKSGADTNKVLPAVDSGIAMCRDHHKRLDQLLINQSNRSIPESLDVRREADREAKHLAVLTVIKELLVDKVER